MKLKKIFLFPVFFSAIFFCNSLYSQVGGKKYNEFIVGVPDCETQQFPILKEKIYSLPGVSFSYTCETQKCFYIRFSPGTVIEFSQIENAIHEIVENLKVVQKTGTYEDFMKLCRTEVLKQQ